MDKTGRLKRGIRRALITPRTLGALTLGMPALALAGPTGEDVVHGDVGITRPDPGGTVVDQGSSNAIVNWDSFSVGSDEYVNFLQPSSSAVILNRVIGNNASEILGTINANGHVFLVNPNGVYFGPGASLDLQGFLATTLDIDNADFLDGNYTFTKPANAPADASVVNDGTITAKDGGYVVLAGDYVENNGVVAAKAGHVVLGAGRQVTLDLEGDGLVNFAVDEKSLSSHAGVKNAGDLIADGGTVVMTARVAEDLVTTAVNNEGLVRARSVSEQGGEIYLSAGGGDIEHTGTIDADATGDADGGKVRVTSDENIHLEAGSRITVRGAGSGSGGDARVVAQKDLYFRDDAEIHAEGGSRTSGAGGFIEVSGHENILLRGLARAGSGGTYMVDPASMTVVNSTATAATNEMAINGSGGILDQLNAGTFVNVRASNQITASTGAGSLIATGTGNLRFGVSSGSFPTNPTLDIDLTNIPNISIAGDLTFDLNNQFNSPNGVESGSINIPNATAANIYIFGGTITTSALQATATNGMIRIGGNFSGSTDPRNGALLTAPGNVTMNAGIAAAGGISIAASGNITATTQFGGGGILASDGAAFGSGAINIDAGGDVNVDFIDTRGNINVTGANIGIGLIGNNTTAGSVTLTASSTGTVGNGNVTMGQANTFGSMNSLTVNATGAGSGGNITIAGLQVTNTLTANAAGGTGGGVIQLGSGGKGAISGGTGGGNLYSFTGNVVDFQAAVYLDGDLTINGNVTGNRVQIGGSFFGSVGNSGSAAFNPNSVTINGNMNAGSVGIHVEGSGSVGNGLDINGSISASNDVYLRAHQTAGLGTGGSVLVQGPIVSSTGNVTLDAFSDGGTLGNYGGGNIAVGTTGVNSTMAPITAGGSIALSASHTGTGTSAGNVYAGALSAGNAVSITAAGANNGGRIRLGDFQSSPTTSFTPANVSAGGAISLSASGSGTAGARVEVGNVATTGTGATDDIALSANNTGTATNEGAFIQAGSLSATSGGSVSVELSGPQNQASLTGPITGNTGVTLRLRNAAARIGSTTANGGFDAKPVTANNGFVSILAEGPIQTGAISAGGGAASVEMTGSGNSIRIGDTTSGGGFAPAPVTAQAISLFSNAVGGSIQAGNLTADSFANVNVDGPVSVGDISAGGTFSAGNVTTLNAGQIIAGNVFLTVGALNTGKISASGFAGLTATNGSLLIGSATTGGGFNGADVTAGNSAQLSATNGNIRVGNVTGQGVSIQALTGGTGSVRIDAGSVSATGTGTGDGVTVTASSAAGSAAGATVNLGNVTTNGGGITLRAGQSGGNTTAASLAVGDVSAAGNASLAAHGTGTGDLGVGSVNAGNDVTMSALTAATGPVTAGGSVLLGGVGSIAGTNLSLTAGNNVDLSNTVYRIDQAMTVDAGADINASGVDIQAGVLVMEAGGSILNGGAAGTITADAMGMAAVGDIILDATTLNIGTLTLAGAGVTPAADSLLRVAGDAGLFDGLTLEGIAPAHTDPNASFVAGGQLTLGNVNLQGSYVFLQANAIDLQQNWTLADPDTLMQVTPFDPGRPTQFESTAGDLPGDPGQLELHAGFDFTDIGTLALGESTTYAGDVLIGDSGEIDMGSTNVIVATTGSVTGLGKIVSTGVVEELSTLLGGSNDFPVFSMDEIEPTASEDEDERAGKGAGLTGVMPGDRVIEYVSRTDENICR